MRAIASFTVDNVSLCKQQMLNWANRFTICCLLDSCSYPDPYTSFDCIAAAGAHQLFVPGSPALPGLRRFIHSCRDWLFGHVAYDLKNELEDLSTRHPDPLSFPDLCFFQPISVLILTGNVLTIETLDASPETVYKDLLSTHVAQPEIAYQAIPLQSRISKAQYVQTVQQLQRHILRGDCYEINFCQEFFAGNVQLSPVALYQRLSRFSPTPFSAYYKLDHRYVMCASPERYVQKKGSRLLSQPIKGTARRNLHDAAADNRLKVQLQHSTKDRIENVMIADLVRNDLSRICRRGSVQVSELFGVYSYPQVHQLITTIQGDVEESVNFADVLQATFPMGSMTGAPKRKVMQLADDYESAKRGMYSGTIGYITPHNDFDFNVVIRSILYNEQNRYLSFQTGGAITFNSNADEEYKECMLKAEAMMNVIAQTGSAE